MILRALKSPKSDGNTLDETIEWVHGQTGIGGGGKKTNV